MSSLARWFGTKYSWIHVVEHIMYTAHAFAPCKIWMIVWFIGPDVCLNILFIGPDAAAGLTYNEIFIRLAFKSLLRINTLDGLVVYSYTLLPINLYHFGIVAREAVNSDFYATCNFLQDCSRLQRSYRCTVRSNFCMRRSERWRMYKTRRRVHGVL